MADFNDLIRQQAEYKEVRQEKFKNDSRVRLSKILKKKVETTMIGALSSIEEHFSFLWTPTQGEMTPEQQIMFDTIQKVRSEILDKGNISYKETCYTKKGIILRKIYKETFYTKA